MRDSKAGIIRGAFLAAALTCAVLSTGCSRASINYQIAESIGTVGVYDNNEPVETPKMKAAREMQERVQAQEAAFQEKLDYAQSFAVQYDYEAAIEVLNNLEKTEENQERLEDIINDYAVKQRTMVNYTGNVPHLCFPTLIADTAMAFDGDGMSDTYANSMITVNEFSNILESLYNNDYVLVDIEDVVRQTRDDRAVKMMERQELLLPSGKKPVIISQDNVNYNGIVNGDGVPTKLVLDKDGAVKAVYTDDGGHDRVGDYDVIPILNTFIEEHPDFAYKGARGIVSVSGSHGIFGYDTKESVFTAETGKREDAKAIASALKASGWKIACAGYDHSTVFDSMTMEQIQGAMTDWTTEIGSLVGETSILFYPYGTEVQYPSEQLTYLLKLGYQFLCCIWNEEDVLDIHDDYTRQSRRFIDGYSLQNNAGSFIDFFAIQSVLDEDR